MSYNVCQKCLKMVPYKEPLCKACGWTPEMGGQEPGDARELGHRCDKCNRPAIMYGSDGDQGEYLCSVHLDEANREIA